MAEYRGELDLAASLRKLSEWLAKRCAVGSFTKQAKRHGQLADELLKMAAALDADEWFWLECEFDKAMSPEITANGMPGTLSAASAKRYKALCANLRDLAEAATRVAGEYPKPRTKPELPLAADFFLRLWCEAGEERPSLYESGAAVIAFAGVLENAGSPLSKERVRGLLADALHNFDPYHCVSWDSLHEMMVFKSAS